MKVLGLAFFLSIFSHLASAQLLVDGKNINEDDSVQYIQMSFYYSGKDLLPIYSIDYGHLVGDAGQIRQNISVAGHIISNQMTPIHVLNKLYHAGWEYLGDAVFMRAPMFENVQVYTMRRRLKSGL